MKQIIYISSFLLLMAFCSCKKNLLDSAPLDKYTDSAIWKDSLLVNLYVSGIYSGLPSEYDSASDLLGNYTDESQSKRTFNLSYNYNRNQYTSVNAPFNALWNGTSSYFNYIRRCNVFMDNIASLSASAGLKKQLTAEVRFLRAFYYHYIHNYFGPFPILKETLNLGDNLYVPRAADADCIDYINSELNIAAASLPVRYTGTNIGRATKGAALALMCRTYLYAGLWQKAADAATSVMNLNTYSLFPDYGSLFYQANEGNAEVIFDKQYTPLVANSQYSSIDLTSLPPNFTNGTTAPNNPNGMLVDAYEMKDGTAFDWNNPVQAAKPWSNRDPRLEATIIHDGSTVLGQIIDLKPGSTGNPLANPSVTNYYIRKFTDPNFNVSNAAASQSGQNFIIMRYAEVLLNYAEAEYNLGNVEEARKYVNLVRARTSVNMPAISSADFNMEKLRHERFIELAFEGLRLWDINRWKIGPQARGATSLTGVSITGTGTPGNRTYAPMSVNVGRVFVNKMYLFPIPYTEIIKYPAGSPLVQNLDW